jgi:hypothetical protein
MECEMGKPYPCILNINRFMIKYILLFFFVILLGACSRPEVNHAESSWHNQTRELRYHPDGHDFIINNGHKRFNRALYGSNSGFRAEAGDLPEFAMYMPRMGGTLRLGIISGDTSKWLIDATQIEARYSAGSMKYTISDPLFKKGTLYLNLLALYETDGMILKIEAEDMPQGVELFWAYGGASNKRFSRDGDLGADPESSFYLKPEYCTKNQFFLSGNSFKLYYAEGRKSDEAKSKILTKEEQKYPGLLTKKRIHGIVTENQEIKIGDAGQQDSPLQFFNSKPDNAPAITGKTDLKENFRDHIVLFNPDTGQIPDSSSLNQIFTRADSARVIIARQVKIETPDQFINAAGAQLSYASDAVWDGNSYMHGAIAWRMPLNGWRGAYTADWLGWHDRAKNHLRGYFAAQYTQPASGPSVPDPATHLARQKEEIGTALFTEGYISRRPGRINRPHHYDMNLVFISQLLWHFKWTGDIEFLHESWPVIERHMKWEKRNFDANNDGLYDAYCCIWASDALQYSGGGVAYSSAYNYRANVEVAKLADLLNKDPLPYLNEAEKIKNAVNNNLWLPEKGWFAEYKDLLGNQLVHPSAGVWSIYHTIDEGLADPFQAYQSSCYIDNYIPHIPVVAEGLPDEEFYTVSTTSWMPYTWSINNVALAEVLHTALAYWKAGRTEKAFTLTKSSFIDYMFLGSSPGNFGQLSYYDAFRGELYRDFADPVGMASRVFVEGLFGIKPNMLSRTLAIQPGWPEEWPYAYLETPDIKFSYTQNGNTDKYKVESFFPKEAALTLSLKARSDEIITVKVNGKETLWENDEENVGSPMVIINAPTGRKYEIEIEWSGGSFLKTQDDIVCAAENKTTFNFGGASILEVHDPQNSLKLYTMKKSRLDAVPGTGKGFKTLFVKLKQKDFIWWQPVSFELRSPVEFLFDDMQKEKKLHLAIRNNTAKTIKGDFESGGYKQNVKIAAHGISGAISVPAEFLNPGTNRVTLKTGHAKYVGSNQVWGTKAGDHVNFETVNLEQYFNDRVTNIFNEQYYSPRSPYPTLSIPVQGIGDWCSYRETEEIDDSGIRRKAGEKGIIGSPQGIPFAVSQKEQPNIVFTSQWDNFPEKTNISLSGKASHLYLLMAGSVHHMQIHMKNAVITVNYKDGSFDELPIISPDNWWPIEQDYYTDGYAFKTGSVRPPRLHLKTGEWHLETYNVLTKNKTIKIEGGAASILDLPLNPSKELASLSLETNTNDVVIGLMAATLVR